MEADNLLNSLSPPQSIEILGAAQEALGITVRDLDALGRTKTVEEVISFLRREMEGAQKAPPQPQPLPATKVQQVPPTPAAALPVTTSHAPAAAATNPRMSDALTVVYQVMADKTGYDVAMIGEEMDLEADLGIDSIKRVEILGATQDMLGIKVQDLDALGRTRTVGEVVAFLSAESQKCAEPERGPAVAVPEKTLVSPSHDAVRVVMAIIS